MEMMKLLAEGLTERGDFMTAKNIYRQMSSIHLEEKNMPGLISTELKAAKCELRCGFSDEALSTYRQLLTLINNSLDQDHELVLEVKNQIATCLLNQGKHAEALEQFEKIAKIDAEKGVENDDTLVTEANIGLCLCNLNKLEEAYNIYQKVLPKQLALHKDPSHPHIVVTKNNIAGVLFRMGKTEEASKHLESTAQELVTGKKEDDISVLETKQNIISSLIKEGKNQKAFEMCMDVQKIIKRIPKHPLLMSNSLNMIMVLWNLEMFDEALHIALQTRKLFESTHGERNPKVFDILTALAKCYSNLGRYEEALTCQRETEERFKNVIDPKELVALHSRIADTLIELKRDSEVVSLMNTSVPQLEKLCGTNHPDVLEAKEKQGSILCNAGKFSEAVSVLRLVEKLHQANRNTNACIEVRKTLLKCYANIPDLNQGMEMYSHLIGKDYTDHALTHSKNKLANKLADVNRHADALKIFQEVEKIMQSIGLPPGNGALLNTKLNIGGMLKNLGKIQEAQSYFKYVDSVEKQMKSKNN